MPTEQLSLVSYRKLVNYANFTNQPVSEVMDEVIEKFLYLWAEPVLEELERIEAEAEAEERLSKKSQTKRTVIMFPSVPNTESQ
jgi:hypothetical protein